MKTHTSQNSLIATLLLSATLLTSAADSHEVMDAPGFRPKSEHTDDFLEQVHSARIAVLPTVIRTRTTTTFSEASQNDVVNFLKNRKIGIPEARKTTLEMGQLKGRSQFDWFQNDEKALGNLVKKQSGADYYLALEYLVPEAPSGDVMVFGAHIYLLDANGENAFSFLLNSHHKMLVDAKLTSTDSSAQGREALVLKGTQVALAALAQQIDHARLRE